MIQSMTAFARSQLTNNLGSMVCEIRSINHRYLEMSMRLPDIMHEIEALMRERIRHHVRRGKIECFFRFQASDQIGADFNINQSLLKQLCKANEEIASHLTNPAPVDSLALLHWPGIIKMAEIDVEEIQEEVLALLEETLKKLIEARYREGNQLKEIFLDRLENMKIEITKVREKLPQILQAQRERLISRFADANVQLDNGRLEQEIVLFAQRIDVSEEVDRLDTHISEVRRVLKQGGTVGRRLDFLMQELNREANTLGSKSVDSETTRVSVELKVLIEQIREQVQNVE